MSRAEPTATGAPVVEVAVDVFYAFAAGLCGEALAERYLSWLSPDELERYHRFMFDGDRELFLLTRALCRSTLSRFGERAPEQWRFVKNAHGKPSLVAEQAVGRRHFNLTNTPGLVACAVTSHGPLGLDAEPLDREVSSESVARRFFSPVEVADFLSLPEASRARRFLEYWTLKEAYIKARGGGLSIPLGGFSMTLKGLEAPSIEHHSEGSHARKTWVFWQQTLAGRYLVALALPASRPLRLKVSLHPADL